MAPTADLDVAPPITTSAAMAAHWPTVLGTYRVTKGRAALWITGNSFAV